MDFSVERFLLWVIPEVRRIIRIFSFILLKFLLKKKIFSINESKSPSSEKSLGFILININFLSEDRVYRELFLCVSSTGHLFLDCEGSENHHIFSWNNKNSVRHLWSCFSCWCWRNVRLNLWAGTQGLSVMLGGKGNLSNISCSVLCSVLCLVLKLSSS